MLNQALVLYIKKRRVSKGYLRMDWLISSDFTTSAKTKESVEKIRGLVKRRMAVKVCQF